MQELSKTINDFIVDPFLRKNSRLLICAKSGIFKTQFTMQLCIDMLDPMNNIFLDKFSINKSNCPKKILWLNGENSSSDLKYKIYNATYKINPDDTDKILENIITICQYNDPMICSTFEDEKLIATINNVIEEENIELFVIDSLSCFNYKHENFNNSMKTVIDKIDGIIRKANIPLIYVHHSPKKASRENYWSGASIIKDYATEVLYIESKEETFVLNHMKTSGDRIFGKINIRFDGHRLYQVQSDKNKSEMSIVIDALKENNGFYEHKGHLILAVMEKLKKLDRYASYAYASKIVENAIKDGIVKMTKGKHCCKNMILQIN